jgi:glycosyltransferase involved in cell wall biosynthesis
MTENLASLAIVIPAYKIKFLRESLQSIAGQTNQNFQLYIGDDCSPEPVADIVREFSERLPLKYHRFDRNLGGISLVQHWERCIRLSNEPWVWIFSDDDLMDEACVAAFYAELKTTHENHDLYRFNTVWVNGEGVKIKESPLHPQEERGSDFFRARMRDTRNSTLQEQIFSRSAWERIGGIPDFPLAWNSDDAFVAELGVRRPIRTIAGPRISFRMSDANVSNDSSAKTTARKITASAEFVLWAMDYFERHAKPEKAEAARLSERWFLNYVSSCWRFLSLRTCLEMDALWMKAWGGRRGWGFLKGLKLNVTLAAQKVLNRLKIKH